MVTLKLSLPDPLVDKLKRFSQASGKSIDGIVSAALDDYFANIMVLPEPVAYQLRDGKWTVEALEPGIEMEDRDGNPILLCRFYGFVDERRFIKGAARMSAMIALKDLGTWASSMEILNADWLSMKKDVG